MTSRWVEVYFVVSRVIEQRWIGLLVDQKQVTSRRNAKKVRMLRPSLQVAVVVEVSRERK